MAHTPDEIKLILDNFKDNEAKLEALKILMDGSPDPVTVTGPDPSLETMAAWFDDNGVAFASLPPAERAVATIFSLQNLVDTMAWSLGYDDPEHLRKNPPQGPDQPAHRFELPDGTLTNSCDEARVAWRLASVNVLAHLHIEAGPGLRLIAG